VGDELRPRRALSRESVAPGRDHWRTNALRIIGGALCLLLLATEQPATGAPARPAARALAVSYSTPKRFGLDRNQDQLIDYQDTVAEVQPRGWPVDFRVAGCRRSAKYRWTVGGKPALFARTGRCTWRHTFAREGSYVLRVAGARRTGRVEVLVQDWLVVGLGDSVGSGEGVPDVAGRGGRWEDQACHRSAKAFEAVAARRLEESDAKTSVTFVHVACSGATGDDVVSRQLPAVRRLVGGREIDAVLASVGANDLNFGQVVLFCVTQPDCPRAPWNGGPTLAQEMPGWVAQLPARYGSLATALGPLAPASRTYITDYFDPLHAAGGLLCTGRVDVGGQRLEVTTGEAQWLFDNFLVPLNAEVLRAAAAHAWNIVGGAAQRFADHGYCAADPWVVRYEDSLLGQGDANGTLHPNRSGHEALAQPVFAALHAQLYPGGRARRPA
jgi:lysophospholipase L1-like esterase